jgi:hypothetical protein
MIVEVHPGFLPFRENERLNGQSLQSRPVDIPIEFRARAGLVSIDTGRQTLLVRKTLAGCPRHVLHLKASTLVGTIAESGAKLTP